MCIRDRRRRSCVVPACGLLRRRAAVMVPTGSTTPAPERPSPIQGDPTPGSDAVRVTALDLTITGARQAANGLYMNFVTFSQGARVRVANFKGFGVKIRKFQDALWGEFSVENCGWSSLGNQDITGVDDGLM